MQLRYPCDTNRKPAEEDKLVADIGNSETAIAEPWKPPSAQKAKLIVGPEEYVFVINKNKICDNVHHCALRFRLETRESEKGIARYPEHDLESFRIMLCWIWKGCPENFGLPDLERNSNQPAPREEPSIKTAFDRDIFKLLQLTEKLYV